MPRRRCGGRLPNSFASLLLIFIILLSGPKKYDVSRDIWEGRVNLDWCFYFTIVGDVYRIEDVMSHPK
jgi:hypothetical protein